MLLGTDNARSQKYPCILSQQVAIIVDIVKKNKSIVLTFVKE